MPKPINTFEDLKGEVLASAVVNPSRDEVLFTLADDRKFLLYHEQDCCEKVTIENIEGTCEDGVLTELWGRVLLAEESSSKEPPVEEDDDYGSSRWTFYRIGTIHGTVVLRWLGRSNGYYSERVDFKQV